MSDLAKFFDGFDDLKPDVQTDEEGRIKVGDDQLQRAEREIRPLYERASERAGLDLSDLVETMNARLSALPTIFITRCIGGGKPIASELAGLLQTIAVEQFLAGVLWEQQRSMPEIES